MLHPFYVITKSRPEIVELNLTQIVEKGDHIIEHINIKEVDNTLIERQSQMKENNIKGDMDDVEKALLRMTKAGDMIEGG